MPPDEDKIRWPKGKNYEMESYANILSRLSVLETEDEHLVKAVEAQNRLIDALRVAFKEYCEENERQREEDRKEMGKINLKVLGVLTAIPTIIASVVALVIQIIGGGKP